MPCMFKIKSVPSVFHVACKNNDQVVIINFEREKNCCTKTTSQYYYIIHNLQIWTPWHDSAFTLNFDILSFFLSEYNVFLV